MKKKIIAICILVPSLVLLSISGIVMAFAQEVRVAYTAMWYTTARSGEITALVDYGTTRESVGDTEYKLYTYMDYNTSGYPITGSGPDVSPNAIEIKANNSGDMQVEPDNKLNWAGWTAQIQAQDEYRGVWTTLYTYTIPQTTGGNLFSASVIPTVEEAHYVYDILFTQRNLSGGTYYATRVVYEPLYVYPEDFTVNININAGYYFDEDGSTTKSVVTLRTNGITVSNLLTGYTIYPYYEDIQFTSSNPAEWYYYSFTTQQILSPTDYIDSAQDITPLVWINGSIVTVANNFIDDGVNMVLNRPFDYGLYTQAQVDNLNEVYRQEGYDAGYIDGRNSKEGLEDLTNPAKSLFQSVWGIIDFPIFGSISLGDILILAIVLGLVSFVVYWARGH